MAAATDGGNIMNRHPIDRPGGLRNHWRLLSWSSIAALILAPAIAMLFTRQVHWGASDFALAAVMLGGVGMAIELAVRASGTWAYRAGAAVALGAGLLLLWANAAVGIVGSENERINLWFDLVPLLALFAAIGARFRARGMAVAMTAAAAAQLAVGGIAQAYGHFTWVFTGVWCGAWLLSAHLFRRAVRGK
jgi:predicted membrane channel-forming protein YqfA (hemolysin III family)